MTTDSSPLVLGQSAEVERLYTAADVAVYVSMGGHKPIEGEIPAQLVGALFSYLLGVKLPGAGTCYLKQETNFDTPARVGERLCARVEVIRLRPEKHLVDFKTTCTNSHGVQICEGRALVYVADVRRPIQL